MDRMIGILGGMGPEATLDLYHHIIRLTPATKDQDHIRVLIYSNPKIPDRTKAIVGNGESPLNHLIESARLLEKAGAGIIAIPCNASHHYLPEIQRAINTPLLNMIEETGRELGKQLPAVKTVGLLAALGTVRSGIYCREFSALGIKVMIPDDAGQMKLQEAINQVKAGVYDRRSQQAVESIGKGLIESGANAVILGCTEIPLIFNSSSVKYPSFNPTKILAKAAVHWALGKEPRIA
jgi:aspartate racemase